MIALILALLVQSPREAPAETSVQGKEADELRERAVVSAEGGKVKVTLDRVAIYDGPGSKAGVDVIEIAGFGSRRFVVVRVDDIDRARFHATSIGKPAKLQGVETSLTPDCSLRMVTEGSTMTVQLVQGSGESREIFRGPTSLGKPNLQARQDAIIVYCGGAVVFMTRRGRGTATVATTAPQILARFNEHRRLAGLKELTLDAELTRACDLHALYLSKNAGRDEVVGLGAHNEHPSLPGFTPEGAKAGMASVISYIGIGRDLTQSVDSLIATLYHRIGMLRPTLGATGVGWAFDADGAAVIVIHVGTSGGAGSDEPVVYPGPDQKDVPREFALGRREVPDPVPDLKLQGGYPVTIQFPWVPGEPDLRLLVDGKPVDGWLSTPERPARADRPQPRVVCFIPKMPLQANRAYTVEARAVRGGESWEKTWTFRTGK